MEMEVFVFVRIVEVDEVENDVVVMLGLCEFPFAIVTSFFLNFLFFVFFAFAIAVFVQS